MTKITRFSPWPVRPQIEKHEYAQSIEVYDVFYTYEIPMFLSVKSLLDEGYKLEIK